MTTQNSTNRQEIRAPGLRSLHVVTSFTLTGSWHGPVLVLKIVSDFISSIQSTTGKFSFPCVPPCQPSQLLEINNGPRLRQNTNTDLYSKVGVSQLCKARPKSNHVKFSQYLYSAGSDFIMLVLKEITVDPGMFVRNTQDKTQLRVSKLRWDSGQQILQWPWHAQLPIIESFQCLSNLRREFTSVNLSVKLPSV